MKAIFAQYGNIDYTTYSSLDKAKSRLFHMEEDGDGFAIGIYDEETNTFHCPNNMDIAGKTTAQVLREKIECLKSINISPQKIEFYEY